MLSHFSASYKSISKSLKYQSGFGLIELMISISIVVIVSAIILTKQSSFNSAVLLRSQAYEIALRAREVQLSAVSASNDSEVSEFRSALGLYFDTETAAGVNGTYKIFRDADGDNRYDVGEEFDVQGLLDRRFMISEIRVIDSFSGDTVSEISVIFQRPNFDAKFFTASGVEIPKSAVQVDVRLRSATGDDYNRDLRTIEFTSTGQISVNEEPYLPPEETA